MNRNARGFLIVAAIIAIAVTVPRAREQSPQQASATDPQFVVTPLTSHGRVGLSDLGPAVSPDGKLVAYIRFEQPGPEVRSEIWLLDRQTGRDEVLVPKARIEYWGLDFAPDGRSVYATQSLPPLVQGTLVRIRLPDGRVETVRGNAGREPTISPDNRFVAFNRRMIEPQGRELVVAPLDGGPERVLVRRLRPEALNYPSWRSDGAAIVFRSLDAGHATSLMEVTLADGRERMMAKPEGWGNATPGAWLPGNDAFVVGVNQGTELWRVSYPDGSLRSLGFTRPDAFSGLVSARTTSTIVGVRRRTTSTLWLAGRDRTDAAVERPWLSPAPIWTTDGNLLFARLRASAMDLIVTRPDGREIRSTPLAVPAARFPRFSQNGQAMVWSSYAVGDRKFWRTGPNGENPVALTPGPSDFFGADISSDATWIAYTTWVSGRFAVWKLPLGGGSAAALLPEESAFPAISTDGRWVAASYSRTPGDPPHVVVVPAGGGEPVRVSDLPISGTNGPRWTADGRVSFVCEPDGVQNICVVPREGGPWRKVTSFTEGAVTAHDWSSIGRLLVMRSSAAGDLAIIDVPRRAGQTERR